MGSEWKCHLLNRPYFTARFLDLDDLFNDLLVRFSGVVEPACIDRMSGARLCISGKHWLRGEKKNPCLNAMEMKRIRMECNQCSLLLFFVVFILSFPFFFRCLDSRVPLVDERLFSELVVKWKGKSSRTNTQGRSSYYLCETWKGNRRTRWLPQRLTLAPALNKGSSFSLYSFPFLYKRRFCLFVFRLSDEAHFFVSLLSLDINAAIISPPDKSASPIGEFNRTICDVVAD